MRRAGDGTRTHDSHLGKVVLYQLSYTRDSQWACRRVRNRTRPRALAHRRPGIISSLNSTARAIGGYPSKEVSQNRANKINTEHNRACVGSHRVRVIPFGARRGSAIVYSAIDAAWATGNLAESPLAAIECWHRGRAAAGGRDRRCTVASNLTTRCAAGGTLATPGLNNVREHNG